MPTLYIFIGYPGAGKTTAAQIITKATDGVHLWADRERQTMFDVVTHSKQESQHLYDALNERTATLLKEGRDVVYDTNFNYLNDRAHMAEIARSSDARLVTIWVQTPREVARERALHSKHSERNGYQNSMLATEFDRLTDHLEAPQNNENYIKIDGSSIDPQSLLRMLHI